METLYHIVAFNTKHSFNHPHTVVMGCILFSTPSYAEACRTTTTLREKHRFHSHQLTTLYFVHKYVDGQKVVMQEEHEGVFQYGH